MDNKASYYEFDEPFHPKKKVKLTKKDLEDIERKRHILAHDYALQQTLVRLCYVINTEKAIEGKEKLDHTIAEYFADHIDEQDLFVSRSATSNFGHNKLLVFRFLHASEFAYDELRYEHDWIRNFNLQQAVWKKEGLPDDERPILFDQSVIDPTNPPAQEHVSLPISLSISVFKLSPIKKELVCKVSYINRLFTDHFIPDLKAVVRQHADGAVTSWWSKRVGPEKNKLLTAGHVAYALGFHRLTLIPPDVAAMTLDDIRSTHLGKRGETCSSYKKKNEGNSGNEEGTAKKKK